LKCCWNFEEKIFKFYWIRYLTVLGPCHLAVNSITEYPSKFCLPAFGFFDFFSFLARKIENAKKKLQKIISSRIPFFNSQPLYYGAKIIILCRKRNYIYVGFSNIFCCFIYINFLTNLAILVEIEILVSKFRPKIDTLLGIMSKFIESIPKMEKKVKLAKIFFYLNQKITYSI